MNKIDLLTKIFKELLKEQNLYLNPNSYIDNFNAAIIDILKEYQNDALGEELKLSTFNLPTNIIIGYMGVEGAFAYEAAKKLFGDNKCLPYENFKSVFEAIKNNEITYGILPIENTSTGSINDIYDLIREYQFYIIKDTNLPISQNLLGIKGSKLDDIKTVYSHPQGILQTKDFLEKHNIKGKYFSNTATSAKYISSLNDKTIGSISSKLCAKLYNLDIIAENINEDKSNTTRFVVISKNLEIDNDANQISIMFNLRHQTGTLYQILKDIKDYNLNMTRIESRPIKNKPFEYYFYVDFLGNINDTNVINALNKIKKDSLNMRILGNYKTIK